MFNFNNIGNKIKTLAQIICWTEIILCVIFGLVILISSCSVSTVYFRYDYSRALDMYRFLLGVLIITVGPVIAWVSCFTLYGFGELIENSSIIRQSNEQLVEINSNIAQNVYVTGRKN